MNAPENIAMINAAHGVLQRAKDALSVAEVAKAIGASKPTASKQLKELYGLGLIESEPRAGGTPFYRLIAEPKADMGIPMTEGTPAQVVCDSVQTEGSKQTEAPEPERALTPETQAQPADDHSQPLNFATSPELQYLAPEDYELPPADPALLAMANRELSKRLEGVAHVLRGCGIPRLADASGAEDLQPKVAALAGAYQMALGDLQARTDSLSSACSVLGNASARLGLDEDALPGHLLDAIDTLRADLNAARSALTNAINEADRLRLELFEATKATTPAVGYLVRAPKRKPRLLTKPEGAQAAALAAVRAGAARAEVLAVVPVGIARRGAEWSESNPRSNGD